MLRSPSPTSEPTLAASPAIPSPTIPPACQRFRHDCVQRAIDAIDADRMWSHLLALTAVGSRDPRHPGHAKAIAYLKEQLGALSHLGVQVSEHRTVHQGIPLTTILATIDPSGSGPAPSDGWIVIGTHYDSIAVFTPGWDPVRDPAPGADDNATGVAAVLEHARILAERRSDLRQRVVLAFFDGEELFFKGSAAYLQSLPKPYPIAAFLNVDMVGFNPITDRLDLFWYGRQSDRLRDRAVAANTEYAIGVTPLRDLLAEDPSRYILDSAPFGVAGIPAVTLTQGYADADATWPGNPHFHTVNDTPDKVTNRALWLKAAKLTLAVAFELAIAPR